LRPDHFCQGADELWRCVAVASQALFVHDLSDCEPEC
jgi:hypothetical protein